MARAGRELGEAPLIGREEEVELLLRRWQRAKSGDGQVVLISGEAGIGKSRLTAALRKEIEREPHSDVLYYCSPHHQDSALYPIMTQLEREAGFAYWGSPESKLERLESVLLPTLPAEDVGLLAELLSLPFGGRYQPLQLTPQRKKERTFGALVARLEGLVQRHPVLMIFEDGHWSDPTSRELLDRIVERIRELPVLLVMTFRPEFQPPWVGQAHVTVLTLNRLGPRQGAALAEGISGGQALPSEVLAAIVERTDGVPLFIEELTKAVLEASASADVAGAAARSSAVSVPTTLQASLMARLDRLDRAAKELAQVGAAIGREFAYLLIAEVSSLAEGRLHQALDELVASGLILQRGAPPEATYHFKHALIQDAAYGTLLRSRRQKWHARIAAALQMSFPDVSTGRPELICSSPDGSRQTA